MKFRKLIYLLLIIPFLFILTSCKNFLDTDSIFNHSDNAEIIDFVNDVELNAVTKTVRVEAKLYRTNMDYLTDNYSTSIGTGVIYKNIGSTYYLLTNNHVISKIQYNKDSGGYITFSNVKYTIYDAYNNSFSSEVLYNDKNYDLAIMIFERGTSKKYEKEAIGVFEFSEAKLKTSSMLCAIGECLGQRNFIQVGYYQKSQKFSPNENETEISNITFNVIVHSAYINNGSSGGALVDKDLKLVGINFASASYEYINKYICTYAIPAAKAKEFINNYEGVS